MMIYHNRHFDFFKLNVIIILFISLFFKNLYQLFILLDYYYYHFDLLKNLVYYENFHFFFDNVNSIYAHLIKIYFLKTHLNLFYIF